MNKLILILYVILLAILFSCSSRETTTLKKVNVYRSEVDAAYSNALNRKVVPITSLDAGEKVEVLSDKYGKDYWACKIKLSNNEVGWVLCNSLNLKK